MDNDEIRIKIAELKGVEYEVIHFIEGDELCIKDDDNAYMPIPNWSVSIADAWELVEEMATPDNFGLSFWDKNIWECIYHKDEDHSSFVEADTAPRAICLAWLEWKLTCSENNVTTP